MGDRSVLGVDTSSARLAWVGDVFPGEISFSYFDASGSTDERRINLYRAMHQLCKTLPSQMLVVIEEPLSLQNPKTNRVLATAAGAIWAAATDYDVEVLWADVAAWKKATVGKGNASKEIVASWVKQHPFFPSASIEEFDRVPDLYDAYAIWRYGKSLL